MDEYIKVKDLVDMLEQRLAFQEIHGFYRDAGYTSRFIESIADIPHINVAPKPEWISVEERLPTYKDGKVLIYTTYGISIGEKTVSNRWRGDNAIPKQITHWMPLPEPPTEKEN